MATLRLTLDKRRQYSDGKNPLIFRLTSKGKSTSIHLGIKLFNRDWDGNKQKILKSNSNHNFYNIYLKEIQVEYEKRLLELGTKKLALSLTETKEFILNKNEKTQVLFKDFVLAQIELLMGNNRHGNAESYKTASNSLLKFKGQNLKMNDIDYNLILTFESHLFNRGMSTNGIAVYMRTIRAIINRAEKQGLYNISSYPFNKFKIKTEKTVSRALSIESINNIISLDLSHNSKREEARDLFVLIFSLIGISFMDLALLKKENITNGRVQYRRRKTGKLYSIKLTPLANTILKKYNSDDSDYLMPQFRIDNLKTLQKTKQAKLNLKRINRYLKQIGVSLSLDCQLTTYYARYSWANIAKSQGYSKDVIAEALGHSYGNHVTGIYLEGYGNEVIDEANERIVSLLKD